MVFMRNNDGEDLIFTRDSWTIPDEGTEIWCTGWMRGQTIKPYGDGYHVIMGLTIYHCNVLMDILTKWEQDGYKWGIEGTNPKREQLINGHWISVDII